MQRALTSKDLPCGTPSIQDARHLFDQYLKTQDFCNLIKILAIYSILWPINQVLRASKNLCGYSPALVNINDHDGTSKLRVSPVYSSFIINLSVCIND